jgi:hypothetical protein
VLPIKNAIEHPAARWRYIILFDPAIDRPAWSETPVIDMLDEDDIYDLADVKM